MHPDARIHPSDAVFGQILGKSLTGKRPFTEPLNRAATAGPTSPALHPFRARNTAPRASQAAIKRDSDLFPHPVLKSCAYGIAYSQRYDRIIKSFTCACVPPARIARRYDYVYAQAHHPHKPAP